MRSHAPALHPTVPGTPVRSCCTDARVTGSCVTDAEREAFIRENLGLVHHVARTLRRRLGGMHALDELVSAGTLGLLQALDTFDPARGLAFSTFATPRIRGAILDELRRQDDAPRNVRRQGREIEAARTALTAATGRAPTDAELAAHLGVAVEMLWTWQRKVAGAIHARLDAPRRGTDDAAASDALLEQLATDTDAPDAELLRDERARVLRDAILALKEQQRVVLGMYYFEDLQLQQIATVLGVSESRISQVRTAALGHLREALRKPLGLAA